MWSLQVHIAAQPDWSASTTYFLLSPSIRVGRPAKDLAGAQQVDLFFQGDSSLSKTHCILEQHGGNICIKDTSRFGISINGEKMESGSAKDLQNGDTLKLASKVHARLIRNSPMTIQAPSGTVDPKVLNQASSIGMKITSLWNTSTVPHCFIHQDGAEATSALALALLSGVNITTPKWLDVVLEKKVWESDLPACTEYSPRTITFSSGESRPLNSIMIIKNKIWTGLTFVFVHGFLDHDLACCLKLADALVVPCSDLPLSNPSGSIVAVSNQPFAQYDLEGHLVAHITAAELLACVFSGDSSSVHQRLLNCQPLPKVMLPEQILNPTSGDNSTHQQLSYVGRSQTEPRFRQIPDRICDRKESVSEIVSDSVTMAIATKPQVMTDSTRDILLERAAGSDLSAQRDRSIRFLPLVVEQPSTDATPQAHQTMNFKTFRKRGQQGGIGIPIVVNLSLPLITVNGITVDKNISVLDMPRSRQQVDTEDFNVDRPIGKKKARGN